MNPRIFGATVAGLILVVGAYVETRVFTEPTTQAGSLIVGERNAPVRGYISTSDQNNDGVADWQEALRTSEPLDVGTLATTTYTVPDTLTDQFAIDLFGDMMKAKSYGAFGDTPEELIAGASDELLQKAQDRLLTFQDIEVSSDTSAEANRQYANAIVRIAIDHGVPADTKNELVILGEAVKKSDAAILAELDPIIASYEGMLTEALKTAAPTNIAKQHLDLVNVYKAILVDIKAMRVTFTDPLLSLLRVQRYQDDATGLYYAFTNVFSTAYDNGARFDETDITLKLIKFGEE